ncbi:unnamed protein product [Phaedon cochleariae]|nr:unnamed protein product [Phaedon cochleariae]
MTYVISAVIDKDNSSIQTILNLWTYYLPFLYSCISFFGVLMLLVCTPIGFVCLFDIVGQFLIKPQFLRDINEEFFACALEEECLRRRLKQAQKTGKAYMDPAPMLIEQNGPVCDDDYASSCSLMRLRNGELQFGLGTRLMDIEKRRKLLDKQRQTSSLRRNVVYPVAMLLLLGLTLTAVLLVVQNALSLLIGIKALPSSSKQFTLGVSSLSKLGPFGAALEIVLIVYLIVTSSIGLYTAPCMKRMRPKLKSTPFCLLIANCALLLIISSALPLLSKILDTCYLDHAGATLYSEKQIQNVMADLSANVYGNPHSLHISSKSTEEAIDIIRYEILQHFNTNNEEYSIVFTSGATAALKIIAECFNYGSKSKGTLVYLENNHTSALGMRSYAENAKEISTERAYELMINEPKKYPDKNDLNNIFVYPAESNFCGTKFPLEWIKCIKEGALNEFVQTKSQNWYVVLDAPCYVASNVLDLSRYKPDFVTISFYKMFGYPTGLGALLVKKTSEELLTKKYFGGGTLQMVLSSQNVIVPRKVLHERFEDGTLPFLSVLAVKQGFETLKRLNLNFDSISQHTFSLARYVYRKLCTLHHGNEKPAVILYHETKFENRDIQGGIVNFNLIRSNGSYIGFTEVLHMANLYGIHLRNGCHCNPGACQRFLKLKPSDIVKNFELGHVCGDTNDLIDGIPTGTIRVSFGYMSSKKDADRLLAMIESCFVSRPIRKMPSNSYDQRNYLEHQIQKSADTENITEYFETNSTLQNEEQDEKGRLTNIFVYPIKSCGSYEVSEQWLIGPDGLKYDREWVIINSSGVCLTQKQNRNMCLIKPVIDLKNDRLQLSFKGYHDIDINLSNNMERLKEVCLSQTKICSKRVIGWDCGDEVSDWLSEALNMSGLRLLRKYKEDGGLNVSIVKQSFANNGMFLLVNSKSVEWLTNKIENNELNEDLNTTIQRFRPNFVVDFSKPFQENELSDLWIGNNFFKSKGTCTRCHMICIDQETGNTSKEPLLTLSKELKGKIRFGVYLSLVDDVQTVLKLNSSVL